MSRIIYTPETKRKKNISSKKYFRNAVIFFLAITIFTAIIYLSKLPVLQINQIEVSGNQTIEKNEIENRLNDILSGFYFYFIPKKNYFLVAIKLIEKNILDSFPRIEQVSVKKKPLKSLLIQIKEREPWAVYCSQKCFFIDKSGFAYEESFINSGNLIRFIREDNDDVSVGKYAIQNGVINILSNIENKIDVLGLGPVTEYNLSSKLTEELKIKTGEGFYLIFNMNENWDKIFTILKTVLNEEIKEKSKNLDYIDLRFGNRVFYKFK